MAGNACLQQMENVPFNTPFFQAEPQKNERDPGVTPSHAPGKPEHFLYIFPTKEWLL